jgi:hypothetical protein
MTRFDFGPEPLSDFEEGWPREAHSGGHGGQDPNRLSEEGAGKCAVQSG